MREYFNNGTKYIGNTPTSLPTILNKDLRQHHKYLETFEKSNETKEDLPSQLKTLKDLGTLKQLAQDRDTWRKITKRIRTSDKEASKV